MREALFIKKNKDRWLRIQHQPSTDPDDIATDFIQLVDDLAYAKTFYPAGQVTKFINAQASRIYLDVYRNRKEESNRLVRFWKYDVPLTMWKHRKVMLFAFFLFVLFFVIGYFTASKDEDVARSVLGDGYVDMTKENIEKGNPFGVYEGSNGFLMWIGIMVNNISVALRVVSTGIFFGLPSMYELARTGVMVGVFNQLFISSGNGLQFWLVVFIHGTLEITAIILAGGAGIVLGKSYLFPGTIRRVDSLKQGAKDAVKIMVGLLPVLGVAAFFEGLFTRLYNDVPMLTQSIVFLSVIFVVWYFIIYPIRLGRRMRQPQLEEEI